VKLTTQSSVHEPPLTETVGRMRIGRCEHAFDLNFGIDLLGKMNEFFSMHIFAVIFTQAAFESCLLWRAMRNRDNHPLQSQHFRADIPSPHYPPVIYVSHIFYDWSICCILRITILMENIKECCAPDSKVLVVSPAKWKTV